jgi:hypothetical protein
METPSSLKNGARKKKGIGVFVTDTGKVVSVVAEPDWAVKLRLKLPGGRVEAAFKVIVAEPPDT